MKTIIFEAASSIAFLKIKLISISEKLIPPLNRPHIITLFLYLRMTTNCS